MRLPPRAARAAARTRAVQVACAMLALSAVAPALQTQERAPESYHAKFWSTASGLPQGTINDILQTASGELWIATFAGLLRFDGMVFEVFGFDTLPELPSNRITALVADQRAGLWLGTQSGDLVRLDAGRIVEVHRTPEASEEFLALARAGDGSLWTQASSGAVRRFEAGVWTLAVPAGIPGLYEGLCANPDGSISVAVGDELALFEASGARRATLRAPARITALATRSAEGPWIGLVDGLACVEGGAIERVPTDMPADVQVNAIAEDGLGGLWVGTPQRPWHVELEDTGAPPARIESDEMMPQGFDVRSLARDREGNLWLGAAGQGLVRLRPHHLRTFGPAEWRGNVRAVTGDGSAGAWVANECQWITRIEDGEWDARPATLPEVSEAEIAAQRVCAQSLLSDRRGRLWVGHEGHLLRRAADGEGGFERILAERSFQPHVGPMVESEAGEVWISWPGGRLLRVSADDVVLEERELPVEIVSLGPAPDGSLWIGSQGLVLRLKDGELERFDQTVGFPRGDVRDFHFDPDGSVWAASYGGGLVRIADGRATAVSRAQGLPDDSLTRILDDGLGRLWMLSNLGLIVADTEELVAVAERRKARTDPVVLGPESGMPEGTHGRPAGFRDERGRLWFGTIAGVVRVDPSQFPFHRTPPLVRIERLAADENALTVGGEVAVPPGTRRVLVDYTAFSLSAPGRVHFHYRLEGFDADWHEAGTERHASYTALAPGRYTFLVEARSEEGVWSAQPATQHFEVLPEWWQTLAFRIAAVVGVSALLIVLHRRRVATIGARARVLLDATEGRARAEQRESRMREELSHAARVATAGELATSLAHEVNQPLAAIVANAQAGRRFLARDVLERVEMDEILRDIALQGQRASDVIRSLRTFLRKQGAARREVDVNALVRETMPLVRRELEDHKVQVELDLGQDLPDVISDPVELQQVIVNLIKNACEAMSTHAGARRIAVRTRARDARVSMEVEDSGPGLSPEVAGRLFQPYVTTKASGMGLGLAICRTIVEAHGGRLSGRSRTEGGTVFCIDLPASTASEVVA